MACDAMARKAGKALATASHACNGRKRDNGRLVVPTATSTNPPFRAEHIGSLLRPKRLIDARDAFEDGRLPRAELAKVEDDAIREVVAYQEDLGLEVVTDGEYRRTSYLVDVINALDGARAKPREGAGWDYKSASGAATTVRATAIEVTGRVRRPAAGLVVRDFEFVKRLARATPKVTMPAPTQIYWFAGRQGISKAVYPDIAAFWDDAVAAWREEIAALAAAGCSYVQIDETCLPKLADPKMQATLAKRGDDWRALLEVFTSVAAAIVRDPPSGTIVVLHHCRGNSRGHWQAEGSYETVAEHMFQRIPVAAHLLEYDSPRAGDFAPLRLVPANKTIVLGLVSTKLRELETADALKRRIDEASRYVSLERLCLSPQCGFASSHSGHPLTEDDQRRKLELIMRVAREVWG
jgi:5-methyltetrahydropteroyltriglutamate--homocysteine methyltransferase